MHGAVKLLLFVPLPRTSICLLVNKANSTNQIMSILCICTVLPAKSDSDDMLCLQSNQGLRSDRSLVYKSYPGLIHKLSIDSR